MTHSTALTSARDTLDYFRSLNAPGSKDYETASEALAAIDAELAANADAGSQPYTHEHHFALREAHCVSAGEAFWAARPGTNDAPRSIAFDAGFVRGFDIATKLADERAALARPTADAGKLAEETKLAVDDYVDAWLSAKADKGTRLGNSKARVASAIDRLAAFSRPAPAEHDWIGPEGQRMSASVYAEWRLSEPERAALYRPAPETAPVSAQGDEVDAARWRWFVRHWATADLRWDTKAPGNPPKSMTITVRTTVPYADSTQINEFVDAARAQQGGQG